VTEKSLQGEPRLNARFLRRKVITGEAKALLVVNFCVRGEKVIAEEVKALLVVKFCVRGEKLLQGKPRANLRVLFQFEEKSHCRRSQTLARGEVVI